MPNSLIQTVYTMYVSKQQSSRSITSIHYQRYYAQFSNISFMNHVDIQFPNNISSDQLAVSSAFSKNSSGDSLSLSPQMTLILSQSLFSKSFSKKFINLKPSNRQYSTISQPAYILTDIFFIQEIFLGLLSLKLKVVKNIMKLGIACLDGCFGL